MAQSRKFKTREFDVANYVETPADVAAYLEVLMEEKPTLRSWRAP